MAQLQQNQLKLCLIQLQFCSETAMKQSMNQSTNQSIQKGRREGRKKLRVFPEKSRKKADFKAKWHKHTTFHFFPPFFWID